MESARSIPDPPLLDLHPETGDFRSEVITGLRAPSKSLPCKYFYDEMGSRLFDRICELEEYYPTRTEQWILETHGPRIAEALGAGVLLIEFGSGSSTKTRVVLDHLTGVAGYVPVDISREHLLGAARATARQYPGLEVLPVCADFTQPLELPEPRIRPRRRIVFFPGSTIGNFDRERALEFLKTIVADCGPKGGLLIGVDLKKDPDRLVRAYDDASGVTAAFNLNLLRRINRELGADFDLDGFAHEARWNADAGRMEMHLVSRRSQAVSIGGERFEFEPGESIHTESSHKYEVGEFAALAEDAGLRLEQVWTDPAEDFSVQYYTVD